MIENQERRLPGIVSAPLDWLHGRWNVACYGFPEGKPGRDRMEVLIAEERIGLDEFKELLALMGRTHSTDLQLNMSVKIRDSVGQLVQRPRQVVVGRSASVETSTDKEGEN